MYYIMLCARVSESKAERMVGVCPAIPVSRGYYQVSSKLVSNETKAYEWKHHTMQA
jgi:hypothetical protein